MSATEELCRLLDEHGVGTYKHEAPAAVCLAFFDGKRWHDCWDSTGGEVNVTFSLTPEQAVAATLGPCNDSCNCTNGERTGERMDLDAATLGSGTCHIADNGPWGYPYVCSACGASFDPDVNNGEFNYCPNCGRKVVDE